jgi:hypothetical protein
MLTILYEDQLASGAGPHNFGPHRFLIACVVDDLAQGNWWKERDRLDRLTVPICCKGANKLLERIEEVSGPSPVVAVVDGDRIREALGLPATAPTADVEARIRGLAGGNADLVHPCILDRNLETILERVRDVARDDVDADALTSALAKESRGRGLSARDRVFESLSYDTKSAARTSIRAAMPTFNDLVNTARELIRAARPT